VVGDGEAPVLLVDIAPTVCHLLDVPRPEQAQGRVLGELLEGGSPAKQRPPRPDIIVPEFPVSKGPLKFKGDVTDEL
jgi:arylsulfatase A-like enzyme